MLRSLRPATLLSVTKSPFSWPLSDLKSSLSRQLKVFMTESKFRKLRFNVVSGFQFMLI